MTVSDNYVPVKQIGNDITKIFTFDWKAILNSDVQVYLEENNIQTLQVGGGVDYTLVFNADNNGGVITFNTAPTSSQFVLIARDIAYTQGAIYKTSTGFPSKKSEQTWDKAVMLIQQLREEISRQIQVPLGTVINNILPSPVANALIGYNANADGFDLFQALAEIPIIGGSPLTYLRKSLTGDSYNSLTGSQVRDDILNVAVGNNKKILVSDGVNADWSSNLEDIESLGLEQKGQTIASGIVPFLYSNIVLKAQTGTTDNFDGFTGGVAGDIAIIRADTGDTLTLKHTATFFLTPRQDFRLISGDIVFMICIAPGSFVQISRSTIEDFANSKTANGHTYLPNGLIIQQGIKAINGDIGGDTAPTDILDETFPNGVLACVPNLYDDGGDSRGLQVIWNKNASTTSTMHFVIHEVESRTQSGNWGISYYIIGH